MPQDRFSKTTIEARAAGDPPTKSAPKPKPRMKEAPQQSWKFGRKPLSSNHQRLGKIVNDLLVSVHQESNTPLPTKTDAYIVTPETARSWLKRNKLNRPVSLSLLRFLMREIEEGRWVMNGQTISFKENGDLSDGQHRLIACVLTAKQIETVIAVNVPDRAFTTVDTGRVRRAPDILALAGYGYTAAMAAAIRWDVMYERGGFAWTMRRPQLRLSNQEILEAVQQRPWYPELAARYYLEKTWLKLMSPSIFIFSLGRLQQIDRPAAEAFYQQLGSGANLDSKSPILTLRERLLEDRTTDMTSRKRTEEGMHVGYIIKAWNAWYEGRELERLFARTKDKFPDFATVRKR